MSPTHTRTDRPTIRDASHLKIQCKFIFVSKQCFFDIAKTLLSQYHAIAIWGRKVFCNLPGPPLHDGHRNF